MQNRKSAKKCRLKKKAEYHSMQDDFEKVNQENNELKNQVCLGNLFSFLG